MHRKTETAISSNAGHVRAGGGWRQRPWFRKLRHLLGPGLITGASDDDPSGIGTYAVAGASLGYSVLWTALLTWPLMAAVQFISAKIALVSGQGLTTVLRRHYSGRVLYPIVFSLAVANTLNAGADLGAVAAGFNLLLPIPAGALIVPIALTILALQIWGSYRFIANTFKWLTLALFAYIGSSILARPDPVEVLRGTLLPAIRWDRDYLVTLTAILGTTISPYLLFWQANQEVEEKRATSREERCEGPGASRSELRYAAWDINLGMLFSNVVMYFIMLGTAATLHEARQTNIQSMTEAAQALGPLAGDAATTLFALGLIGSGFLAVPILTASGAYAVAEMFRWKTGLDQKPARAKGFYGLIMVSTLVGLGINVLNINLVTALFWSSVVNGLLAPPLLAVLMVVSNDKRIMGNRINGRVLNFFGWTATILLAAAAVAMIAAYLL